MQKLSSRVLALYVLTLLWLLLFKFSYNPFSVLLHYQARGLNLIPFSGGSPQDAISNAVVFFPLGLLLGANLKQIGFWPKVRFIFYVSLAVEILQFICAIGVTDVTDTIMNTAGGLVGLALYGLCSRYMHNKVLDWFVVATSVIIVMLVVWLRIFVFKVKY